MTSYIIFYNESLLDNVAVPVFLQDHVRNAKISGNLDAPEGGLDAVMQVITCEVCC